VGFKTNERQETRRINWKESVRRMVRGVVFEPTKAFATGLLLCRSLSQAPSDKRRPCPFDLSPAHRAFALGLGNPRRSKFGVSAFLKPLKSLGNCSPVSRHPLTKTRGTTRTNSPSAPATLVLVSNV